jgi:hypothetical protein
VRTSREFPSMLLAAVIPFLFTVAWLIINTQLPLADAANFLSTAIDSYNHFINDGIWHGLVSCYFDRGWRPILFPVIIVPFLLLFKGKVLTAYSVLAGLCLLASTFYIYSLFRLTIGRLQAILGTALIGLLPVIQAQILGFFAESALLPCVFGGVYHLLQSNYLRNRKHTIGFVVLTALALTLRPVEAVMNLIFVFCAFLFMGWYKQVFSLRQLGICLASCATALSLFLVAGALHALHHTVDVKMWGLYRSLLIASLVGTGMLWGYVFLGWIRRFFCVHGNGGIHSRTREERLVQATTAGGDLLMPAVVGLLLLVLLWFLPAAFELFQWVYQTSIGDVAAATGTGAGGFINPQASFWHELNHQVMVEGKVVVAGITLIVLSELVFFFRARLPFSSLIIAPIYLLLITPLPLLELFLTIQNWPRKVSIAFPALFMALLMMALARDRGWSIRTIGLGLLLLIQMSLLATVVFGKVAYNPRLDNLGGYYAPRPVKINPNPHSVVEQFLTEQAQIHKLKSIAIEVNPDTAEPVDPFLLDIMVKVANVNYHVEYPYFSHYSRDNLQQLATKYDAIFLSHSLRRMQISAAGISEYAHRYESEVNPSIKTLYQLLLLYSQKQLASAGWELGPCLVIKSACMVEPVQQGLRQADCFGCLLLRSTPVIARLRSV